jgi:hypothetical protein
MRRLGTVVFLACVLLPAARAVALDVPVDADGLTLRRMPSGRETLEFVVRDRTLGMPQRRSADDPSMPAADGAVFELFAGDGSSATFVVPGGGGWPGWRVRDRKRQPLSYRYLNPWAPAGPTPVREIQLQERDGIRVVGRKTGLSLALPLGRVAVRLTVGDLRFCALFDESTVVIDRNGRFGARHALAAALPDCSDESLRTFPLPPETTTTTSTSMPASTSSSTTTSSSSSTTSTSETTSTSTSTSTSSSTTSTSSSTTTSTSSTTSTSTSTTTSTTLPGLTFGNAVEFAGASNHSPGFLLGSPVSISTAVTVTHLSVIAKAGGANVLLGLYRSSGGVPTTLVVGTTPTALVAGRMEIPVTTATRITAGTYWIMAMYDTDASVGVDTSVPTAPLMYAFRDFSAGLPATVSGPTSMFGQRYNYYVRGIP